MKKLFFLLFLFPVIVFAQTGKIITHTVVAKESLSSIGRKYSINPRQLANYNKIDYAKPLAIGQVLKIPVQNTVVVKNEPTKEVIKPVNETAKTINTDLKSTTAVPLYYIVGKKETLYSISKLFAKVSVADLKKWNNLNSDVLKDGTELIVGYKDAKANDAENTKTSTTTAAQNNITATEASTAEKSNVQKDKIKTPPPVVVNNNTEMQNIKVVFFKTLYDEQTKGKSLQTISGTSGVFKSTSGWEDGKYYCLHNSITAGTIVKITCNSTKKFIYAKVLDVMPDLKENSNIILRISNAAAGSLGIAENTLDCSITYANN